MKLEEYEHIMRTGTPSDRARAIAAASNDKELGDLSRLMAETGEP